MPNCPNCNASVAPGSRFCPSCGSAISTATYCPGCGSQVAPGSAFCTKCGTRIGSAPQTAQTPTPAGNARPGIALGGNIPAFPQTPAQPIQPQQAQPQPQNMAVPVSGAPVVKTYGGLKALKIILWIFAIISMAFVAYSFMSYFVYDYDYHYSSYYDWYSYEDILELYYGSSYSSYSEEVTVGLIVSIILTATFLVPAIIFGNLRKKLIRRQQEAAQ